jgi:hypothetical protein
MFFFNLDAQVLGTKRSVRAEVDGLGIVVHYSEGIRRVRSWGDAIRVAERDIGEFIRPAGRPGVPWGLRVSVPDGTAVYGEWPLLPGPPSPDFRRSLLSRIRDRLSGPSASSALENAVAIITAYALGGRAAA